jgi:hypothetical protein
MLSLEEQMTQTGVGIGTPAYMGPEQARGETNIGPTADIYSLGIVIYEMLTGRVPFSADTPLAVMVKVMNDPIPVPRAFSPDIPDVLQGVILKATAKESAQRYQTADALFDALKRSLDVRPTVVTPEVATQMALPPPPRPTRRVAPWLVTAAVLAALLCVLLAGAGVWLMWPRPNAKEAAALSSAEQQAGTPTGGSDGISEAVVTPAGLGSTATTEEASTPPPVSAATAKEGELLFAQTLSGTIAAAGAVNKYTFEAAKGDSVLVRIADPAGMLAPEAQVFGPDGQEACSEWQYAGQTLNAECQLENPGRHTLLVGGHDTTGSYSLYVQRTNNPTDTTGLDSGATVSGVVETMAGMKSYTFEAAQGDTILVRIADPAGELAPEAQVFGPDGQEACSEWQYAGQTLNAECQLDTSGRYTLLVGGHDTAGSYNLTLHRGN